ncbi:MAG: GntR family transcriptional regulator [Chloroflexaceae bacterium]|nr:GntR family transcriptional regulator [Chloroflexaceae bacterium]NJO05374.1 GntR family transcriptional regulator [Chloroflexaceae bacterium]
MSIVLTGSDTTADPIYEKLRRLLIAGRYAPGEHLVEERLAHDLGVSRTPVRQALARAAAEGLVRIYPNRGAVVRTFTPEDLIDAYDLRAVLEGYAAYQAVFRITPEQLAGMEQHAAALEASLEQTFASTEEEILFLVEQNQHFHTIIITASGNQRLAEMLMLVVNVPLQYRSFNWYTSDERRVSNFFHRSILQALRARHPDRARATMQEHIYRGRDALLKSLIETEKLSSPGM